MRRLIALLMLCLAPAALADVQIKSGASSTTLTVNTANSALVQSGVSTRPTYTATLTALASTTANVLSIESSAGTGFKLSRVCIFVPNATASAAILITVQRRTTASSGGTALTAEGTGVTSISKHDPADGNYGGVARLNGTPGTAGAIVDAFGFWNAMTGASPPIGPFCKEYGANGEKMPTVLSGTSNGLSISNSVVGAGGTALMTIAATIIAE